MDVETKKEYLNFTQSRGLGALESLVGDGAFCVGNSLTIADLFFFPQVRTVIEKLKVLVTVTPSFQGVQF